MPQSPKSLPSSPLTLGTFSHVHVATYPLPLCLPLLPQLSCPQIPAGANRLLFPSISQHCSCDSWPFFCIVHFFESLHCPEFSLPFIMGWKFFKGKDKLGLCSIANNRKLNASSQIKAWFVFSHIRKFRGKWLLALLLLLNDA